MSVIPTSSSAVSISASVGLTTVSAPVSPWKLPIPNFCNVSGEEVVTIAAALPFSPVTISFPTRIPPVVPALDIVPNNAAIVTLPDTSRLGSIRASLPSTNIAAPPSSIPSAVASAPIVVAYFTN